MTKRASEDILAALHSLVAQQLTAEILTGDPKNRVSALNAAIKFLQNNGIEAVLEQSDDLNKLQAALPTFDDDDAEETIRH